MIKYNKDLVEKKKININNEDVLTVKDFAKAIYKSPEAVYRMIYTGNRVRRIKTVKLGNYVYIPVEEIEQFPWTPVGRPGK